MQNLRDKLIAFLERSDVDLHGELKDDTPLIKSGRLDSLSLFLSDHPKPATEYHLKTGQRE